MALQQAAVMGSNRTLRTILINLVFNFLSSFLKICRHFLYSKVVGALEEPVWVVDPPAGVKLLLLPVV